MKLEQKKNLSISTKFVSIEKSNQFVNLFSPVSLSFSESDVHIVTFFFLKKNLKNFKLKNKNFVDKNKKFNNDVVEQQQMTFINEKGKKF